MSKLNNPYPKFSNKPVYPCPMQYVAFILKWVTFYCIIPFHSLCFILTAPYFSVATLFLLCLLISQFLSGMGIGRGEDNTKDEVKRAAVHLKEKLELMMCCEWDGENWTWSCCWVVQKYTWQQRKMMVCLMIGWSDCATGFMYIESFACLFIIDYTSLTGMYWFCILINIILYIFWCSC